MLSFLDKLAVYGQGNPQKKVDLRENRIELKIKIWFFYWNKFNNKRYE